MKPVFLRVWTVPIWAGAVWWAMLISVLVYWIAIGRPSRDYYGYFYEPNRPAFYYLREFQLKYLWEIGPTDLVTRVISVVLTVVSSLLVEFAIGAEVFLRQTRRLRPMVRPTYNWWILLLLVQSAAVASSLLDAILFFIRSATAAHLVFGIIFIVCANLTALASIGEYHQLYKLHRSRHLRVSVFLKTAWFVPAFAISISLAACAGTHKRLSAPALAWAFQFYYPFYLFIMAYDFWPSHDKETHHYPDPEVQRTRIDRNSSTSDGTPVYAGKQTYSTFGSVYNGTANDFSTNDFSTNDCNN